MESIDLNFGIFNIRYFKYYHIDLWHCHHFWFESITFLKVVIQIKSSDNSVIQYINT